MKFNYARAGQIVIDKITLKKLTVVEVSENEALLVEKDKVGNPTGFTSVLTKDNAICFRLFDDPNPLDIPKGNYTADEGILFADEEPVTENQGEIKVLDVLGKIRGAVIITARTPGSEHLVDLMAYEPFHDRFNCLKHGLKDALSFVSEFEDVGVVNYLCIEKKTVKDENDKEEEVEAATDYMTFIVSRRAVLDMVKTPYNPDAEDIQIVNGKLFIGGEVLNLSYDRTADEITGRTHAYLALKDNELNLVMAEKSVITKSLKYGYVFKNEDMMMFDDGTSVHTDKLAKAYGFPYLVDVTRKQGITEYTFADAERNIIRLVRKETKDRGYCYSIEE